MHDDPTKDRIDEDDDDGDRSGPEVSGPHLGPLAMLDAAIERVYRLARTIGFVAIFIVAAMAALGFVYTSPGKRLQDLSGKVDSSFSAQRRIDAAQTDEMIRRDSIESAKLDKLTRLVFFMIYDQCQRQTSRTDLDSARCRDIYRTMRPDP